VQSEWEHDVDMRRARAAVVRCVCGILIVFCLVLRVAMAGPSVPPFDELASGLGKAGPATQIAFVEIAVDALILRYRQAAADGSSDPGWVRGTEAFIDQLRRAAEGARSGGSVQVLPQPDEGWRVIVGSRPAQQFVLAPPRPSERAALEREVAESLCARISCSGADTFREPPVLTMDAVQTPADIIAAVVEVPPPPRPDGIVIELEEAEDSLSCDRGDGRHARLLTLACDRVTDELETLLKALHATALGGRTVDWSILEAQRWSEPGMRLQINAEGESVLAPLPLMTRYPGLLGDAFPWLKSRLTGSGELVTLRLPSRLIYSADMARLAAGSQRRAP